MLPAEVSGPAVIQLKLSLGYTVTPGTGPNTWVFDDVTADLTLETMKNGMPRQLGVHQQHRFTVRSTAGPEPRYRICHWISIPPTE
jgi:hypothetical protein